MKKTLLLSGIVSGLSINAIPHAAFAAEQAPTVLHQSEQNQVKANDGFNLRGNLIAIQNEHKKFTTSTYMHTAQDPTDQDRVSQILGMDFEKVVTWPLTESLTTGFREISTLNNAQSTALSNIIKSQLQLGDLRWAVNKDLLLGGLENVQRTVAASQASIASMVPVANTVEDAFERNVRAMIPVNTLVTTKKPIYKPASMEYQLLDRFGSGMTNIIDVIERSHGLVDDLEQLRNHVSSVLATLEDLKANVGEATTIDPDYVRPQINTILAELLICRNTVHAMGF
ncbi:hypothetical protein [Bacillus thuringiensis]|nr:hypothetical protein [Bacillus thuringiensis]